jgi:DNA-binding winged helix-turn-helix (wHTH) protein
MRHYNQLEPEPQSKQGAGIYVFGKFRLDVRRQLVFRGSEMIRLPDRLFRILCLLIEANGRVVTRNEIAEQLWAHDFVSVGSLNQHVYLLRQLLHERAKDRAVITTAAGKGYRIAVPVLFEANPIQIAGAKVEEDLLASGLEAYHRYCDGFQLLERRTGPALVRAIDEFDTALSRATGYAPALIGLARCYIELGKFWYFPASSAFREALNAISRVLEVEATSPTSHAIHSAILLFGEWDWRAARSELDKALCASPTSSYTYEVASWYHLSTGAFDEALANIQRAIMLDPSSLWLRLVLGVVLIHGGDHQKGIQCLSQVVEADGELPIARRFRAQAFILSGQPDKAMADLLVSSRDRVENPLLRMPLLARAYADCGDIVRAEDMYEALREKSKSEYVWSWSLAIVAVSINRLDEAMDHLECAVADREPQMLLLEGLSWFQRIANHPRFRQIMHDGRRKVDLGHTFV